MALISCPECEARISDKAEFCPHCGCPRKEWESSSDGSGMDAKTQVETDPAATRIEESSTNPPTQGTRRLSLPSAITDRYIYVADLPSVGSEADPVLLEDRQTGTRVFMKYYRGSNHPDAATMRRLMQADPEHVVRTLEYHEGDDGTWEMQEYCKTGSLKDWAQTKGGRLTKSELTSMVQELTDAIHYLHHLGEGIAHRDLKPGNVLVRSEEPLDLVLADFGLSKQQALTNLTHTVNGTWHYAAPEVYMGESTTKSDWFALGAMVYVFYTGRKLLWYKIHAAARSRVAAMALFVLEAGHHVVGRGFDQLRLFRLPWLP